MSGDVPDEIYFEAYCFACAYVTTFKRLSTSYVDLMGDNLCTICSGINTNEEGSKGDAYNYADSDEGLEF